MDLENFFSKKQIIKLKATEKKLIFKEMVEKLQDLGHIENKDRYYAQIAHRESLENTSIGNGFAIPHARTESVTELISLFGILDEGIDYHSIDEKPVTYIMLSIFPSEMSTKYLYLIGMMARIFSNPEKKQLMDNEKNTGKLYTLLKRESKSYFNTISEKENTETSSSESLIGVPSTDLDLIIRLERLYNVYDESSKPEPIGKKIEEIKKLIDNRSLTYYERMRKKRSNPFSIVEKNSCSGCHMGIPPIYIQEIKDRKGIPICTHCGRFLILV